MLDIQAEIQAMVDMETSAWNSQDADALVDIFHPDMVWAWPPDADSHDPATWVLHLGRYDRARWRAGWQDLFRTHELVHNNRSFVGRQPARFAAALGIFLLGMGATYVSLALLVLLVRFVDAPASDVAALAFARAARFARSARR